MNNGHYLVCFCIVKIPIHLFPSFVATSAYSQVGYDTLPFQSTPKTKVRYHDISKPHARNLKLLNDSWNMIGNHIYHKAYANPRKPEN